MSTREPIDGAGWIDATVPMKSGMVRWPGSPPVEVHETDSIDRGDHCTVSVLRFGSHTGTHVDAPAHCLTGGAGVDVLPLDVLCGPAFVLDLVQRGGGAGESIGPEALEDVVAGCTRLLLRTHDGSGWGQDTAAPGAALTEAAAGLLLQRGVRLCGIDRLSLAPAEDPLPVHALLLGAGAVIVEGLDLRDAPAGACTLLCLPLKIAGGDGAPARVVLVYE